MAELSVPTNFRPEIGIAEIPVYYRGNVVALGVLLRDGIFSYRLADADLTAMIGTGAAQIVLNENQGHFSAEISHGKNGSSSMS